MKLYDSKGNLTECKLPCLVNEEDYDFWEERAKTIDSKFEIALTDTGIDIYKAKQSRGDALHGAENVVCGVTIAKNQVDGEYCGFAYFSTTLEEFSKGSHGLSIGGDQFLCMSGRDSDLFPEVEKLIKSLDFKDKDYFSANRNEYLLVMSNTDRNPQFSGFRWEQFCVLKSLASSASYKDDTLKFFINGKQDTVRIVSIEDKNVLEYRGNFYANAKDFVEEYKDGIKYDYMTYGINDKFEAYVTEDFSLEEEEYER